MNIIITMSAFVLLSALRGMICNDANASQPSLDCKDRSGFEVCHNETREGMNAKLTSFYKLKKVQLDGMQENGLLKITNDGPKIGTGVSSHFTPNCLIEIYDKSISQLAPGDTGEQQISQLPASEITKSATPRPEAAKVQVQQISAALDLYRLEIGRYPTQEEGLAALVEAQPGLNKWNGPYLKKKDAMVDPWGRQFVYKAPGEHGDYDLYSFGSDNAQGGSGEDQDITNW